MNAGKLYALAKDLADENEEKSVDLLADLSAKLQDVVNNPAPEYQQMRKTVKALESEIKSKIDESVKPAVKKYLTEIKEMMGDNFCGRSPEEIETQITNSVKKLIQRYDDGFAMNVRGEKYELNVKEDGDDQEKLTKKEEEENHMIDEINTATRKLTYQNKGEPQIPEFLTHDGLDDTNGSEASSSIEKSDEN